MQPKKKLYKNALDISNEDYHADNTRVSKSGLDQLSRSPAHYFQKYLSPSRYELEGGIWQRTDAMILGSAVHAAVFEPYEFESKYTVAPQNAPRRPTPAQLMAKNPSDKTIWDILFWENFDSENRDIEVISANDFTTACRIRDAVLDHPGANTLINKGGFTEQTFHFTEPQTKVKCKIRPDFINADRFIIDLKTTDDAREKAVRYHIQKYRYDVQDAFYCDGFERATKQRPEGFIFIFVEKDAPYNVRLYFLDDEDRGNARNIYLDNLRTYSDAKKERRWRGYEEIISKIKLQSI